MFPYLGLHTKQWVARAFWQENPASLRESWRLCSTRAHESGSRAGMYQHCKEVTAGTLRSPNRKIGCWTVFLWQNFIVIFSGHRGQVKGGKDA